MSLNTYVFTNILYPSLEQRSPNGVRGWGGGLKHSECGQRDSLDSRNKNVRNSTSTHCFHLEVSRNKTKL